MKAVLLDAPGPPSSLRIGDTKDPAPSAQEVLVRICAAALNPVDFKVAAVGSDLWRYPHVLGVDAAGAIEQVGSEVTDWRPGDRVFYHATWRRPGTYAELNTVPSHTIARIPEPVHYVDAAAIPCTGLTAYSSLQRGEIRSMVSQVILLEEIPQSLATVAEGHVRGKLVAQLA
jgi:NADPH:quinone reductase